MFMADRIAVMRAGRLEQLGAPTDLYCAPANGFVAAFFGDVNRLDGTVEAGRVVTPFGPVDAPRHLDGTAVEILIRPEAIRLAPPPAASESGIGRARVVAARMLGRSSLVHLAVMVDGEHRLHVHARVPGHYLPRENELLSVTLDRAQTFVFAREAAV
jgi:iron(III) transport system ATP-binding protein